MRLPPMDLRIVVGANVRRLREVKGLPQDELAHLSAIHPTYLSGVETGKRNCTLKVLQRLAAALEVPEVELVRRD